MTPSFRGFTVTPKSLHELFVVPQIGDYLDGAGQIQPSSENGDWMMMDDVTYERPILDLKGHANILKRRDATCKLIYGTLGKLSDRHIRTTKVYAAVEDCREEFYQGCFQDYANENWDMFKQQVLPLMYTAVSTDVYSNKYFGDVTRTADPLGNWSWNKFDGVFKKIGNYMADTTIGAGQAFSISSGTISSSNAKAALDLAWSKQDATFRQMPKSEKVFYVDENLADAYWDYLVNAGYNTMADRMGGRVNPEYKGVEVKVKQWDAIMAALVGAEAHAIVLTVKANFLFATDKIYGGGPDRNEALRVFYSNDDDVWRYQIHLKAGTEVVDPRRMVIGITNGIL